MELGSTLILFSFLLGLALGSFLNVCIYRIPQDLSIVHPPSSCPECGEKIRFYDNIPLLSYVLLRGRCRHCRKPISLRYPLVEMIMGLLSVALYFRYGFTLPFLFFLLFTASLVVITFIDLDHTIIPDVISLPGTALGFLLSFFSFKNLAWFDSLIGIMAGGGFLYLVAFLFEKLTGREGMGGGDIKLLAMIGAWLGWKALPFIVLISSLAGTLIGGGSLLLLRRELRTKIPFGPFLALGAMVYFFFTNEILSLFLRLHY